MDSTKYEAVHDEEQERFLRAPEARTVEDDATAQGDDTSRGSVSYCRLFLELVMAVTIVVLIVRLSSGPRADAPGPVPTFPRKAYTYIPNPRYVHENMFSSQEETLHTLHNWIELSAVGRGFVQIPESERHGLSDPYVVPVNMTSNGPAYMMSVFHQLHCLSYLVSKYQTAFTGDKLTEEIAHHSAHCFEYLRQSIMCAADTNLEGKTETGPGWGSVHQCKDYDAVLEWANERSAKPFRGNMPEEAIL